MLQALSHFDYLHPVQIWGRGLIALGTYTFRLIESWADPGMPLLAFGFWLHLLVKVGRVAGH